MTLTKKLLLNNALIVSLLEKLSAKIQEIDRNTYGLPIHTIRLRLYLERVVVDWAREVDKTITEEEE